MVNHKIKNKLGTIRTPKINSLMVRPFDIRAIKMPNEGAQENHHAQYKIVH